MANAPSKKASIYKVFILSRLMSRVMHTCLSVFLSLSRLSRSLHNSLPGNISVLWLVFDCSVLVLLPACSFRDIPASVNLRTGAS